MATTFDRNKELPGLPPPHLLDGSYKAIFSNRLALEEALLTIKTTFESNLKANVNLVRISAPMFLLRYVSMSLREHRALLLVLPANGSVSLTRRTHCILSHARQ